MKFAFRIGNIELRSCDKHLLSNELHTTAEVIYWYGHNYCYVIAYWEKHSEGCNLRFCGDRPLKKEIDKENFFILIEMGQVLLEKYFDRNES